MKSAAALSEVAFCILFITAPAQSRELPDDLTVTIGGFQQHLKKRSGPALHVAAPARVRGKTVVSTPGSDLRPGPGESLPTFPRVLAVVTTQELASHSKELQSYVDWRLAEGWHVIIATETQWDVPTTRDGDDRQARIRAWLKRTYEEQGLGYVLLIGDPSPDRRGIPMRRMEPLDAILSAYPEDLAASLSHVPSDHYYADLESDWDCNGDGTFGAYPADLGDGCADWGPEVIVGRIPVYADVAEADAILTATLDYERAGDKSYRKNLLFAGAFGGFRGEPDPAGSGTIIDSDDDMAVYLDRTAADLPADHGLHVTRLYEDEGAVASSYPHDGPLNRDSLVAAWNQGASTVAWAGHGNDTASYRLIWQADVDADNLADASEVIAVPFMERRDVAGIVGPSSAFVHMMSCLNGFAEDPDNLGTALLGHGAIGTASASRSAIGVTGTDWEPRPELASATDAAYYFVLLVQQGVTVGEALAYTKWALPGDGWDNYEGFGPEVLNAYGWITKAEYNLYGDPTLSIEACTSDADCDDGLPCDGTEHCAGGFCVHDAPVVCPSEAVGACETRRCDNATGQCAVAPGIDGVRCDDGQWCTVDDQCQSGACVGLPRACPDAEGYIAVCDESGRECTLDPVATSDGEVHRGCGAWPSTPLRSLAVAILAMLCGARRVSTQRRVGSK